MSPDNRPNPPVGRGGGLQVSFFGAREDLPVSRVAVCKGVLTEEKMVGLSPVVGREAHVSFVA